MDSNPELWTRDDTPKSFMNPLDKPVTVDYYDETNTPRTVILPPFKIVTHPGHFANLLIRHLVDAVINERNLGIINAIERQEIVDEIQNIYGNPERTG